MTEDMTTKSNETQPDRVRILGFPAILMALLFTVTWIGAVLAYGWGFFDLGSKALSTPSSWGIAPHIIAAFIVIAVLPVAFIWMTVITLGRAAAMTRAAAELARAARRLTSPVTYMGDGARTVIAEIDQEFDRLKSEVGVIDQLLGETHERMAAQISLLKNAGESAGEQAANLQKHLGEERQALQELARMIGNEGARISSLLETSSPEEKTAAPLDIPISGLPAQDPPKVSLQETAQERPELFSEDRNVMMDRETGSSEPPKKLTPIEELSNYIGQHQTQQQEKTSEPPPERPPENKASPLNILPLSAPTLSLNIDESVEIANDLTSVSERDNSQGRSAETEKPGTDESEAPDKPDIKAPIDIPAAITPGAGAPAASDQDMADSARNSLSLSRRVDRARLPVDLRTNIDGLHALAIDLNRLLSTSPPADLWRRYMNGEREVFTEHLLIWKETAEDSDVDSTAASETFQRYAERFRKQFDDTIKLARTSEAGGEAVAEIKASDVSRVNDLLLTLDRRDS